jgi:hypothetical protein
MGGVFQVVFQTLTGPAMIDSRREPIIIPISRSGTAMMAPMIPKEVNKIRSHGFFDCKLDRCPLNDGKTVTNSV